MGWSRGGEQVIIYCFSFIFRALTKEEKGKENTRKLLPHKLRDSSRQASVDRAASALRKKVTK